MTPERIAQLKYTTEKGIRMQIPQAKDMMECLTALESAQLRIAELEGDRDRIDWLEEHQKPTMVDGRPEGLAAVIVHHIEIGLRDAIDAARKAEAGEEG